MNFFEKQRDALGLSQRSLASRIGVSNESVRQWEADSTVPSQPIAKLAVAYEVSEKVMEREVMALRRRIEARHELSSAGK